MCETFLGSTAFMWFIGYIIIAGLAVFLAIVFTSFINKIRTKGILKTSRGTYTFTPKEGIEK